MNENKELPLYESHIKVEAIVVVTYPAESMEDAARRAKEAYFDELFQPDVEKIALKTRALSISCKGLT
jgi:hypothetical protein